MFLWTFNAAEMFVPFPRSVTQQNVEKVKGSEYFQKALYVSSLWMFNGNEIVMKMPSVFLFPSTLSLSPGTDGPAVR